MFHYYYQKKNMSLKCPICGKVYKRNKKNYDRHLLIHSSEASTSKASKAARNTAVERSHESYLPQEDTLETNEDGANLPMYLLNDDEEERIDDPARANPSSDFTTDKPTFEPPNTGNEPPSKKRKMKEKPSKPFLVSCGVCKKKYCTLDGYIRHSYTHQNDLYVKPPELSSLQGESTRMAEKVLEDMKEFNSRNSINGDKILNNIHVQLSKLKSKDCSEFLKSVSESLLECFQNEENFVMPSVFREKFIINTADFMNDLYKRSRLMCKLLTLLNFAQCETLDVFLSAFLRFSQKVLAFILHWMIHGEGSPIIKFSSLYRINEQSTECLDFKQTMHYIGGANVKKVLKNCLKYSKGKLITPNDKSARIVKIIKSMFIVSEEAEAPDTVLMEWTMAQDRGRLIKISAKALDFFVYLGKTIQPLEHVDGSLLIEEVIEKVSSSPHLVFLWDDLVQDSLQKEESFQLLYSLCHHLCVTWRNGIISRRMDELSRSNCKTDKLGKGGVAFRAKLV